jgi:phosphate transport system substrate-binding protein
VLAACGGDDDSSTDTTEDTASENEDTGSESEDDAEADDNAGSDLSGSVRIDGSSTVAPLSEAAAQLFMEANSGVQVSVATSGTGGGFEKFCNTETDISDASREIKDEEADICGSNDVAFEQLTVANDALSVLVNVDNPVQCLTTDQLAQIWGPDSTISNWNEIDGLDADFDQPLDLYGPGTDSGTFDYFTDAINGEEGAQRTDYNNIGEDDETGIIGVEGSAGGLFYVGYTYYVENQDRVKALEIDGGGGCVAPAEETVQDGSYTPLGRGLFIYPSDAALARTEVQAFLDFYINENDAITSAVGAIPLTDDQKSEALDKVAALMGG